MAAANTEENLVLELEVLKEMRNGMADCLELLRFIRSDLQAMEENMEVLEDVNKKWCDSLKQKKRTESNTDITVLSK